MPRLWSSACHDLYQIYQVLFLQMSSWSLNEALILWWTVSGRFVGPFKWFTDRKSASAARLGHRLVYCQHAGSMNMAVSGLCFFLLISIWIASLNTIECSGGIRFCKNENQSRYVDSIDKILLSIASAPSPIALELWICKVTFLWKFEGIFS